ncbi:MAG: peptide-methionine (R)-S-oxide reductase MsrB [Myxococcota bacterium]
MIPDPTDPAVNPMTLTDAQWKEILPRFEYQILRHAATERAGTGRYLNQEGPGAYHCVGCGNYLYDGKHKFHSGCGWPSFFKAVAPERITTHRDNSYGMVRVEMRCARCGGHLGHIFNDAPFTPTGNRHCVNGFALIFVPEGDDVRDVIAQHRS